MEEWSGSKHEFDEIVYVDIYDIVYSTCGDVIYSIVYCQLNGVPTQHYLIV